jgi:apolipoprotein N-acyltransferase
MTFAVDIRAVLVAAFAIALTSALIWFGNGLEPLWPLMWIAPLPVLVLATRASWRVTAIVAMLSMLFGSLAMWHYFRVLGQPPIAWLSQYAAVALVFTLATLLFRGFVQRGAGWSALLALPATWVSAEYISSLFASDGTAGNLAYTQLKFLPFIQIASVIGVWGVSFLLLAFSSAVAVAIHLRRSQPRRALYVLGVVIGVIGVAVLFGTVRLAQELALEKIRVGLVASDESANVDTSQPGLESARLARDYAKQAERLIQSGARVVVLPEKIVTVVDGQRDDVNTIFQGIADKTGATIVVGMVHVTSRAKLNEARVYAQNAPILTYDKHNLVPHWEAGFTPGTSMTIMQKTPSVWGLAICKDLDYTSLSRRYGQAAVGMMLVPAWDFGVDRAWHGHIAVMRGVEDGFTVVRAAKQGYLTVSDDRGRILAETRSDAAQFSTMLVDIPTVHDHTLYLVCRDTFAWLCFAILVVLLASLLRTRRALPDAVAGRPGVSRGTNT